MERFETLVGSRTARDVERTEKNRPSSAAGVVRDSTLSIMKRLGIVLGVVQGPLRPVQSWIDAALTRQSSFEIRNHPESS